MPELSSRSTFLSFQPPAITDEEIAAVSETLRSGWLTTGPRTAELEARMREFLEAKHVLAVSSGTAQDHLVDQTAQQRLAMLAADRGIGPQFGEALAEGDDLGPQARIEPIGLGLDLACAPREGLFGATQRTERRLPAPLEFGRDEPIVGIDAVELPFGEAGFVAEPLDLLHLRPLQGFIGVALRLPRPGPGVNLRWRPEDTYELEGQ